MSEDLKKKLRKDLYEGFKTVYTPVISEIIIKSLEPLIDRIEKLEEKVDHLWSLEYEDFT